MDNKFGLKQTDLDAVISILEKYSDIESAVIFGSRAKGNYKNGSDVDIALKGQHLNLDTIHQISYWLNEESLMPYKFDILNYHTISSQDLLEHIDRAGIEFYSKPKEMK